MPEHEDRIIACLKGNEVEEPDENRGGHNGVIGIGLEEDGRRETDPGFKRSDEAVVTSRIESTFRQLGRNHVCFESSD